MTPAFDELLRREHAESGQPSIAAAVTSGGRTVWSAALGIDDGRDGRPVTPRTQYRIGSITKTFVAVEIMRLRDEGLLDLADPIGRHLADVPFGHVTIAQLLTHTAGLQAETNGPWWERTPGVDWGTLMSRPLRLAHTPGTRFHYSNVGYAVLGRLVEVLRDRPWFEVIDDEVLAPLQMSRTTYAPDDDAAVGLSRHPHDDRLMIEPHHDARAMAPAGQLWSSVDDLVRWAAFAAGDTGGVLTRSSWDEMVVPLAVDDRPDEPWATAQGLGWRVWPGKSRGRRVGHSGSMPGFLAVLMAEPATRTGVVVLTNDTHHLGDVAVALLDAASEAAPAPVKSELTVPSDVAALVGDWYWGAAPFRIEPTADGFHLSDAARRRHSRFVREDDHWVGLDTYFAGERLHLRDDGAIEVATFVLSRTPYDPEVRHPGGLDPRGWH